MSLPEDVHRDWELLYRAAQALGHNERCCFPREVEAQHVCRRLLLAWAQDLRSGHLDIATRQAALDLAHGILHPHGPVVTDVAAP